MENHRLLVIRHVVDHRHRVDEMLSTDLDVGHHSEVFVVENVTVEHGLASEVLERDADGDRLAHGDVDGVAPSGIRSGATAAAEDLERPHVEVEGVIHHGVVRDGPVLGCAEPGRGGDPIRRERLPVDHEFAIAHRHRAEADRSHGISRSGRGRH